MNGEDDGAFGKQRAESNEDMEEGSDADWNNVASGSDDYGGDDVDDGEQADDDDDDGGHDGDDDEERDLIILCSMSLGRWERYEQAIEAAAEVETGKQVLSSSQGLAARRQIFNPREAFSLLSRELLDFLRARHMDCSIETGGDDLYHWVVDLGSFSESSALAKDMREVSRRFFYSTVRLRLRFMRGLHPFFPPAVELVWPHFAGPLLGAVASHPMLRLENWDPWRPVMSTVGQIKAFLEAHARVDLEDPANDIRHHPQSTYSPLERGLARLEALSGVAPVCVQRPDIAALYAARDSYDKDAARLQALAEAGKKRGRSEPAGPKRVREVVWARGTGYGSGHDRSSELWDAKSTEAAQRARDAEIQALWDEMYCSLVRELGPRPLLALEAEDLQQERQQQRKEQQQEGEDQQQQQEQQQQQHMEGGGSGTTSSLRTTADTAAPSGDGTGMAEAMEGVEAAACAADTRSAAAESSAAGATGADAPAGNIGRRGGGSSTGGIATEAAAVAAATVSVVAAAAAPAGGCCKAAPGGGGDGGNSEDDMEPCLGPERCVAVLRDSCLMPFIVRELQLASFTDLGARHKYYSAMLVLLRELCRPGVQDLLWMETEQPPAGQSGDSGGGGGDSSCCAQAAAGGPGRCVAAIITMGLRSAAKMYLNVLGPNAIQAEKTAAASCASTSTTTFLPATRIPDKVAIAADKAVREAEATQRMAKIIMQIAAYIDEHAPATAAAVDAAAATAQRGRQAKARKGGLTAAAAAADSERVASGALASTSTGDSALAVAASNSPNLYLTTLKPLQVDAVPGLGRAHHYANNVRSEQQAPRTRAVRLAKEVASLDSLLPLSESSGVFVRVDETAVQLWKAIVVGPEDTPYSGGCFVFDLYFPSQYPNVPPQVHLLTTGGGRVRFNPNLYAEGKVCLSLLGTWSGDRGENWNPEVSTAVQVLISIQALIMVSEPYFNEPSYESQTGDRGKAASKEYNKNVRENCVRYAMLDVLRHPPTALADVVRAHFRLRHDALLTQILAWADEAGAAGDAACAMRLLDMRRDLDALIGTL